MNFFLKCSLSKVLRHFFSARHNLESKSSANNLPLCKNIHIWDPSPTLHPKFCTRHFTFTSTHTNAHHISAQQRRKDSINNPFESGSLSSSFQNFEHPAIALHGTVNYHRYPKYRVPLTTLTAQRQYVYIRSANQGF